MRNITIIFVVLVVIGLGFWCYRYFSNWNSEKKKQEDQDSEGKMDATVYDSRRIQIELPSETPPIYDKIEAEKAAAAEKAAHEEYLSPGALGLDEPPYDSIAQWKLTIVPDHGRSISFGAVESLVKSLNAIHLPMPMEVWALSKRDKKYYPARFLPSEALNVVILVVFSNRVSMLTQELASAVFSKAEELATQCDAQLLPSIEVNDLNATVVLANRVVTYYNKFLDLKIAAPEGKTFSRESVDAIAKDLGFEKRGEYWLYRSLPYMRDGEFVLHFEKDPQTGKRVLIFSLDIPLCNIQRGDMKRFFANANHITCALGGQLLNQLDRPLRVTSLLKTQAQIELSHERMTQSGIAPGSERAYRLFSSGGALK